MPRLDYHTAGESHGPALIATVTGLPAGLDADAAFINAELARRQGGYGRGGRQNIEDDNVEFLSGLRRGRTIGSPVTMVIRNKDARLDDAAKTPAIHRPRPGHADLAGSIKYLTTDCRDILERASARETAARTAAGALARCLLRPFGIESFAFVRSIGGSGGGGGGATDVQVTPDNWQSLRTARDASETYCPDPAATAKQCDAIRKAKIDKDTLGGVIECHVFGVPPGLGSCMDWRDKLDARLAYAAMSIQAIKGVEIGLGFGVAARPGSQVHDPIRFDAQKCHDHPRALTGMAVPNAPTTPAPSSLIAHRSSLPPTWRADLGYTRDTNNAGGTEGGMTNGQPIVVRAAMKPISTLLRGMPSIDLNSKQPQQSAYERSDVCAVPAASVVLENVAAFEVARALADKFPGDTLRELRAAFDDYLTMARGLPLDPPMGTTIA